MPETDWIGPLTELLGTKKVVTEKAIRDEFGTDRWHAMASPDVVVHAECTEDVQATLRFANERNIPVTTRGAGVGYVGGCVPVNGGILLSVIRMNQLLELNTRDGIAEVQPGVILADLNRAVNDKGWYYPPDPASLKECSIGGTIATNAGGPRCLKYGVTRHYILGLEVVLPNGDILDTGGRCHKNKTGLDLIGMFVGSEGLLGVITKATLRIIPEPESRAMLTATYPDFSAAAKAVESILNSRWQPSALEITDAFTLQAARDYLGADTLPEGNAHLIVEIDGRQKSILSDLEDLYLFLEQQTEAITINRATSSEQCEAVWHLRREFSYSLRATGLTKLNEDVVVPRSKLVELVEYAQQLQEKSGVAIACFGHAGDGNIHTNLMVEDYQTNQENRERADAALDELFRWVIANNGQITGEHGVGLAKKRWFNQAVSPVSQSVHAQLKKTLDPNLILNPGKFIELEES